MKNKALIDNRLVTSRSQSQSQSHSHSVIYYHMPTFQAFYVTIRVDGKDLPEYNIQVDDNERHVSCWIPSEAGKVSTDYTAPFVWLSDRLFRTFQSAGLPQSPQ